MLRFCSTNFQFVPEDRYVSENLHPTEWATIKIA